MYIMTNLDELLFTGDLGPCRLAPGSIFELAAPRLSAATCVVGQLEPVLTERGAQMPQARLAMRVPTTIADALGAAGFSVVSIAGNHSLDWGTEGLADTVAALTSRSMRVVGAGENLASARTPVVAKVGESRIAVVAVNSILPKGYEAEDFRAGCAPARAFTHYEHIEHDQPGTPARVHSFANREDAAALSASIQTARSEADFVVVSIHWGIHFIPNVIAHYQRELAHAAIDAGADVVIGHHPHILKGVEVYKSKVIFYSLGNFAIDPPTAFDPTLKASKRHQEIVALNKEWEDDGEHTTLRDSAMAVVARCVIGDDKKMKVTALPVHIDKQSRPAFLQAEDLRFGVVKRYLEASTVAADLNGSISTANDELEISAAE